MSLKKEASAGMAWTFAEQFGGQIIGFIVSIILARILLPSEFGLIGMIGIFVGVGNTLVYSGLTESLIRSKNANQEDYSTVFYFNLMASVIIYLGIYFAAPLISDFYDQPILMGIIRLYCLTFIISAFSAVQLARLTKNMDFKVQTIIALPAILAGGIVGVSMAYHGYGVWSLVWNHLTTAILSSLQLWIYSKWSPGLKFNIKKFKYHINFGYKLTLSSLVHRISENLYLIVIGKYFSASQVGFYSRAETMKNLPAANLTLALNKVTFPLFVRIQDDDDRLREGYGKVMKMVVFIIAPLMVFLAVLAEPVFRFLLTAKWLPAVPYFQILCAAGILYPVHAFNLNLLKVKGRSDLFLKLILIQKGMIIPGILIGLQFGILGLVIAQVIISVITFFVNASYTKKFIDYSSWNQVKDIGPIIMAAIFSGIFILLTESFLKDAHDLIRIISGVSLGLIIYFFTSYLVKIDSISEIKSLVTQFKRK